MKKILITGISGFIGHYLYKYMPADTIVHGIYNSKKPSFPGVKLIKFDLSELEAYSKLNFDYNVIIHAAAMSGLAECEKNSHYAEQINYKATQKLSEMTAGKKTRMVYLSTDIVFEGTKGDYLESDKAEPVNIYGKTKKLGELAVMQNSDDYCIARIALCLGKGLGGTKNFLDWFRDQITNNQEIRLFNDEIRTPTTPDYIARAVWELALGKYTGTIHLTGTQKIDRYSLGQQIARYLKLKNPRLISCSFKQTNSEYNRPADVSMKSGLADKVLTVPQPQILKDIRRYL